MEIDGVFSGGGIKGFALVGAYEEIEKRGFRFVRVAGASAGAIIAGLIAAKYSSEEIDQLLSELQLEMLLDERKKILPFAVTKWIFLFWRLGLYKGNELEHWLRKVLEKKGLVTFADLPPQALRVIASDLTNGRLMVLPDDLRKYGIDPRTFPIAKAIRMSCSIPYFFEPVRLNASNDTSIVVDGGVLSNFPMWLFDRGDKGKRTRPVLGVRLSSKEPGQSAHRIHNAIQMFAALFETMKDAHDSRYISRKHEKNIIFIPLKDGLAIEFSISEAKKQELKNYGRECARKFLDSWTY